MTDVLIRGVAAGDLELLKAAAAEQEQSLQAYLEGLIRARVEHLVRTAALGRAEERLAGRRAVPDHEREAVLDEIEGEHERRATRLGGRRR